MNQSIEEKIQALTPVVADEVLSIALSRRNAKQRSFDAAIQAGIDDLDNDRYIDLKGPEELRSFLDEIEEEVFDGEM